MHRKLTLFFILLSITPMLIYGQDVKSPLAVGWYPQLMFIRGLRADVDIHLGKSKSWLVIAPQYFLANRHNNTFYESYDDYNSSNAYKKLEGYGLEIGHRIYVTNNLMPEGVYLSYGIMYNHYDLTYEDESWGQIEYVDLDAITYGLFEHNTHIDKLGPNILIGYQKKVLDRIYVDIFCGGGMRYSIIKTSSLLPRNFDSDLFQFGYTGTVPLLGFRIGIVL